MRTIDWSVDTGVATGGESGSFEVEDNETDEEIQQMVDEIALNIVSWGWSERGK